MREDRYSNRRQRENPNPSFSSTLLDAIYRSIDEGEEDELVLYRETMRKTRSTSGTVSGAEKNNEEMANLRRACLIEKWMEKKVSEKVVVRRKSATDLERKFSRDVHPQFPNSNLSSVFLNSSSSSSDSSSGGGSSSEAESIGFGFFNHKPKPIRTSVSAEPKKLINNLNRMDHDVHMFDTFPDVNEQQKKHQNGFVKTKSKAMKIYGDLKKVKQPISPGGRLASFLNSLFTAGNPKKAKISSSTGGYTEKNSDQSSNKYSKSTTAYSSTCSSASSFSRSCLSKTPSSRGKSSNGVKRSVRFGPVSVVVGGEDLQPCGQDFTTNKSFYKDDLKPEKNRNLIRDSVDGELKLLIMEKNRRVEEVARDLLKNYQKKVESEFNRRNVEEFDEDEDDDDDGASCASSDLFELDNLSAIGIERYREELPVYETTHFDTNRAIAKGLIC